MIDKTGYFKLSEEDEKYIWDNAIIVLDTSTLGNLYCLAEEPKRTLIEIFEIVKKRIWLPGHVVYEYKKNRDDLVAYSFRAYDLPKDGVFVNKYESEMDSFLANHRSDKYHPYLESISLEKIVEADKIIRENLKIIKDEIKAQYGIRQRSLQQELADDVVKHFVAGVSKGEPFDFSEQMDIVKEGELRYRNLVPPGYEDAPPFFDKKKGLQHYGDLIVWKEILRYAKENSVPVLFVCNDRKNDWYHFENNKVTPIPRHELIKEFQDETGQLFWMYSLKDFINKLEDKYKDTEWLPLFPKLEIVKRVLINNENRRKGLIYKNPSDELVIRCAECDEMIVVRKDEIDWDWDYVDSEEGDIDIVIEYEHVEYLECENGHQVIVTFRLWENQSLGVESSDIECEGGEIEEDFDFEDTLPEPVPEEENNVCQKCGKHGPTDEMGLCLDCRREYQEFMEKDD